MSNDVLYIADPIRVRLDAPTKAFNTLGEAKAYVESCVDGYCEEVPALGGVLEDAEWNKRTFEEAWGYDVIKGPGEIAGHIECVERSENV